MRLALLILLGLAGLATAAPKVAVVGDDAAVVAAVAKSFGSRVEAVDEASADAIVRVTVKPGKRKHTATLVVVQAADDATLGRLVVRERRRKLAAAVQKQAWKKLGRSIRSARPRTAPPPAVAVAAAPPPADPAPPPPARSAVERGETASKGSADALSVSSTSPSPRRTRRARYTVAVDERPFIRRLRWNDDLDQVLRRYDLAANAVGISLTARPLRNVPRLFVHVAGELTVGVSGSRTDDGMAYGTSSSELSATLGVSARLAGTDLSLAAAYGEHRFSIDGDQGMGGELLPDVTYRYARGGLDAARPLTRRLTLTAGGGYRHLLSTGDLSSGAWFPRSTGAGLDGSLGLHLRATRWLAAYARADVRHYFFTMNPEPGDPLIAGGAVDTFLGAAVGLALTVR